MSNLTPEQERINRYHNNHKANNIAVNPDCFECKRQANYRPPENPHDRLRREVAELNKEYGTNYRYSEEKGLEL